ncbi:hypothetical protein LXA43DRAFT_1068216 [Ganoderma leucocontextum]|nr:hypothetical protein LXA43DRAFT_1068216 [Ganoderma leucocontextum]
MWEKFLYYADAIRWIEATTVAVSPGTITLLAQLLPQETFADSNNLLYMLGPSLDELELHVYDFYEAAYTSFVFSEWAARVFHASAHLCPCIQFLSVGGMGPLILDISVLSYFSSLHRLIIAQQAFDSDKEVVAPPTLFHRLEDLELVSHHGSNSLLKSLQCIIPFLANTLRTIYIQSAAGTSALVTHSFIDNFRPLLNLSQLTEVRLNFRLLYFQFTDNDLVTVAKAWPSIVEMGFAFRNLAPSPVPRLETIGVVATHCQFLKKITMPNVLGPDGYTFFEISAPPLHPLQEIRTHTMTWNTHESNNITSSLKQAFPDLRGAFNTTESYASKPGYVP